MSLGTTWLSRNCPPWFCLITKAEDAYSRRHKLCCSISHETTAHVSGEVGSNLHLFGKSYWMSCVVVKKKRDYRVCRRSQDYVCCLRNLFLRSFLLNFDFTGSFLSSGHSGHAYVGLRLDNVSLAFPLADIFSSCCYAAQLVMWNR